MAGYCPTSLSVFIDREKGKCFLQESTREIPGGQNRPILPARIANKNTGFALSCPLADSEHCLTKLNRLFKQKRSAKEVFDSRFSLKVLETTAFFNDTNRSS